MKLLFSCCTLLCLALLPGRCHAQDFVYEPKNPSFGGGNSFNYSWLLSSATSQDTNKDPAATTRQTTVDPLADFATSLNRQILSQLTDRFITSQFGQGAVKEGNYSVGGYQIQVTPGSGGVTIVITDPVTGNQTTVTIPSIP